MNEFLEINEFLRKSNIAVSKSCRNIDYPSNMDSLGESWVVQLLNANSIVGGELESFEDHLLLYSFADSSLVVTLHTQKDIDPGNY